MFRFAPSPTGDMHIGNLRAALINFICARQAKKGFILRIEDTDAARNIAGKDEQIKQILRTFGLCWEHEYLQSANYAHHRQIAAHLLRSGRAFACVCTAEELDAEREAAAAAKRAYRYSGRCECNCADVGGAVGDGGAGGGGGGGGGGAVGGAVGDGGGGAGATLAGTPANSSARAVNLGASGELVNSSASGANPQASGEPAKAEQIELLCAQLAAGAPLSWGGKPCTIRLKKPTEAISFTDEIKGPLRFEPADIDSFVIMRADCSPIYNFACCCDDLCEGVSMIIRGEDHVSNTPKQEHIRAAIGAREPMKYAHLPIILSEGKKMSKREESSSVAWLMALGILPAAIANYLLLLGNSAPKEIFTLAEAEEFFDLAKLSRAPANFDLSKLLFINREHLKLLADDELARLVFKDDFIAQMSGKTAELGALCKLYLEEASTLAELSAKLAGFFLPAGVIFKERAKFLEPAQTLAPIIAKCPNYSDLKALSGLSGKNLFKPLRLLLSAAENGPELAKIYELCCPLMGEILELRGL